MVSFLWMLMFILIILFVSLLYLIDCDADINECETNNGFCSDDASCTNTVGAFTCACNSGYTDDGFTCSGK